MLPINHLNRDAGKAAWRPREWAAAVGIGRVGVFALIRDGRVDSVKLGARIRLITTPPSVFLASLKSDGEIV